MTSHVGRSPALTPNARASLWHPHEPPAPTALDCCRCRLAAAGSAANGNLDALIRPPTACAAIRLPPLSVGGMRLSARSSPETRPRYRCPPVEHPHRRWQPTSCRRRIPIAQCPSRRKARRWRRFGDDRGCGSGRPVLAGLLAGWRGAAGDILEPPETASRDPCLCPR